MRENRLSGSEGGGSKLNCFSLPLFDYPDVAASVADLVASGDADGGIVIDGAGIGSAIAANKIDGIRAVMATSETIARYAREHNGANVLTLGATLVSQEEARAIVATWLTTPMREPRFIRRLAKIRALEDRDWGLGTRGLGTRGLGTTD